MVDGGFDNVLLTVESRSCNHVIRAIERILESPAISETVATLQEAGVPPEDRGPFAKMPRNRLLASLPGAIPVRMLRPCDAFVPLLVLTCAQASEGCQADGATAINAESTLVANDSVVDVDHDGRPLRLIAEYFGARGVDLRSDVSALELAWPLAGPESKVLNRFGTPQLVLNRGYYHTALDVIRHHPSASDDVFAPVSGQLMIFDASVAPNVEPRGAPKGYQSIVAIYDSASHLVVTLLHVAPATAFASITGPVPVTKGTLIGTLGSPLLNDPAKEVRFHHTHLNVVDGASMRLLDPAPLMRSYKDSVAPTVEAVYLLDELADRKDVLHTGRLDVIVDAFDRDDDSRRNLEVSAIAYEVRDGSGNLLRAEPRCNLGDLVDSLALPYSERARSLVDFGRARSQVDGEWPNADIGNPNRRFGYALTHLSMRAGRCTTLDDTDGYLDVPDSVARLDVHVTRWDPSGNVREDTRSIVRAPGASEGPRRLVSFTVDGVATSIGQSVYVLGDAAQIGAWRSGRAAKLSPTRFPRTWTGTAWLPVGATVQLKVVKITPPRDVPWGFDVPPASVVWESGPNRTFTVPPEPAAATVEATWPL